MKARAAMTPVVLLVLAVGAIAYAYLVDRGAVSDADRSVRRRDVFPSLHVDDVVRVVLVHGSETLVLERDPRAVRGSAAAWSMTRPRPDAADATAVDVLLRELELAPRQRDVADGPLLGLDTPRARGSLKVGPLEYRFSLGADAPRPEGAAYMRVEGEGTFVVAQSLKVQLLRGADAYRDRTIVPLGGAELARLELRASTDGGFVLERSGSTFRLAGSGLRASRVAVDRLLSALADARADSFLGDADAVAAPDAMRITLSPRDPARPRVELRLGPPCPGSLPGVMVVRTAPTRMAACTSTALVEALEVTAESLADASPLYAHADEIEQMRLERLGGTGDRVELARKGAGWHERSPEDRDLDADESESATTLALALTDARSEGPPRVGSSAPMTARTRVTIVRTGSATSEAVELATLGADGIALARRLDDGAILRLSRSVARHFEPHAASLRRRAVWSSPFDAGAVVAIDDGCAAGRAERLELRDHIWTMASPPGFDVDPMTVADVAGALAHAKADAWIADRDDGGFGFDRPDSCSVTLTLDAVPPGAPGRRVSLIFGAEGDGGVYARTLDDPAVFVAPRSLHDLVSHPAVDRTRLRLEPREIASAVLTRGAARLVLERSGERLMRREGGDHDATADRLESALSGLYAQAAVHTGPPSREEGMDRPTLEISVKLLVDASGRGEPRITIGAPTHVDAQDVYFARVAGVDATFAVSRRAVSAVLEAW